MRSRAALLTCSLLASRCDRFRPHPAPVTAQSVAPSGPRLAIDHVDTRFETASHMRAGIEMQLSGEPFAEALGRDLAGFGRNEREPDRYNLAGAPGVRDLPGYSAAVESYEYSKQPMNMVMFESGAGVSLAFGSTVDTARTGGRAAHDRLRDLVERFALASHAGTRRTPSPTTDATFVAPVGYVTVPAPSDNELNTLGFSGLWPVSLPYRAFDPTIRPSSNATRGCSIEGGYGASTGTRAIVGDYECGYRSLHLVARRDQLDATVTPGATGFTAWKDALWVINYLQRFHDTDGHAIVSVPDEQLANVGTEANAVRGVREDGMQSTPGTWLGSTDLEGFQAALLIQSLDEMAASLTSTLTTTDGHALGGFASLADALAYDHASTLRWVPGAVTVTEQSDPAWVFPAPIAYTVATPMPALADVLALLGGFAEAYALVDPRNREVGNGATTRAWFDGSPFAHDNGIADGEPTAHDRWLAVVKLALVDLDRLFGVHGDRFASTTELTDGLAMPGGSLTTTDCALTLVTLRNARRALSGRLVLYADATADPRTTRTALDGTHWSGAPHDDTVSQRFAHLLDAHATLLYDTLTRDDGSVSLRWNTATGAAEGTGELLASAAAVRGLLEAYLATGTVRYRDRAEHVWARLERTYWDDATRMYFATDDHTRREATTWTPELYGTLSGAMREMYKLVASRPGHDHEALARTIEQRFARTLKLVLNGWDDRNDDGMVQWPAECVRVEQGLPRGGLQLAERALTGESGVEGNEATRDRDHDCVPEIDDALLPAVLGSSVHFTVENAR